MYTIIAYTVDSIITLTYEQWLDFDQSIAIHKTWHLDNKLHRVGGLAVEYGEGIKYWYIGGRKIVTEYDYNRLVQEVKDMPLALRLVDPRKWVREFKECI